MRILKIILISIILGTLAAPLLSCASESDSESTLEVEEAVVQRGNLTIDITASGNLALSCTEDLAFEIAGTVEEVLVEEGDTVEEGQVLATLDTSEWEDNLAVLEDKVTTEERGLLQAQINLQTARQNLKNSQDNQAAKELALLNAQISLDQAEYNLSKAEETYTWPEVEVAQADVDEAEAYLQYALDNQAENSSDIWNRAVANAQAKLNAAQTRLNAILTGYDTEEVSIKKLQVESAEKALAQAQENLDKVATDVAIKELQIKLNQGRLDDALKALDDAREALDEAISDRPEITAPFTGFITRVNVEGGDEVKKGTVAVQLADPAKFEADIMVSEMDILQVKLGGEASVQVDAMQGMSLPAKVTHIPPTATIQAGVVNYKVKVELESLNAVMQERQEARQEAIQKLIQGELPERLQQAIEEGRITQEQAEEMIKQRQQGQGGQQGQTPTMIPEDFQLREGLTVTVSILVEERNNVLLVPNRAITRQGMESYVNVSKDGVTEERAIKTGISNWQYTEVTEGLSEGEKVVVPQGTATTSTTQQQRPPGGIMIPGMRRPPR